MNLASITQRLMAGELHYALGRFETVRRGYSLCRGLGRAARAGAAKPAAPSLFASVSPVDAVEAVRRDSIAWGFDLPPSVVRELTAHAETVDLFDRGRPDRSFRRAEVEAGRLPDGDPVALGIVRDPMAHARVREICHDPVLMESVTRFLGYRPGKIIPRLFWSFASAMEDDERRRRGQTIDWHFDVHDLNFISANFYLTDVDRWSGAHALVRGSHKGKPLRLLMGSANAPHEAVMGVYGADKELIVEGPSGTGFLEDTSCYHRAIAPTRGDRLMMQIWYS
ncbi:hypothetical protein [Azospirillum sp. SYSU D00513]|uniref:hypothetical protein n=1 Tax=Azospirillum sp. SYSU D00513 TaxID=2812561 RepID=UPI001A96943F|nr:hypothetical protein [Azospirillum sp. SYSU D00513]